MAAFWRLHTLFIVVAVLAVITGSELIYRVNKVECITNKKVMEVRLCKVQLLDRYKSELFIHLDQIQTIHNFTVLITMFKQNDRNRWNPFLVNVTGNMCALLGKDGFQGYLSFFQQVVRHFQYFNRSCPFQQSHLVADHFDINEINTQLPYPLGNYKVLLRFDGVKPAGVIADILIYMQIIEIDKRRRFLLT